MSEQRHTAHEAMILFTVGGTRFAIAAGAVEEICSLEGLVPLRLRGYTGGVTHALERRGRRHLVIDAGFHFEMLPPKPERVLLLRNSAAAILVGGVDRMQSLTAIHSLPRGFQGLERQWYRGLALLHDGIVPVINPESFVSKAAQLALQLPAPGSKPVPAASGGICA